MKYIIVEYIDCEIGSDFQKYFRCSDRISDEQINDYIKNFIVNECGSEMPYHWYQVAPDEDFFLFFDENDWQLINDITIKRTS